MSEAIREEFHLYWQRHGLDDMASRLAHFMERLNLTRKEREELECLVYDGIDAARNKDLRHVEKVLDASNRPHA